MRASTKVVVNEGPCRYQHHRQTFATIVQAHRVTTESVARLQRDGNELRLVPQILYEYWVVATRPARDNGFGFSFQEAHTQLSRAKQFFPPFRDERGVLERWEKLIVDHKVHGKPAHDARLVAAMERHGLTHILTFNVDDFKRYPGIQVLDPAQVAAT